MKHIVTGPHITEKSLALAAKGYYSFVVTKFARKEEIKGAIHSLYNVHVREAHTIAMTGKIRRSGKNMKAATKTLWKKAVVRLATGGKIDAFEVSQQKSIEKPDELVKTK